MVFSASSSTACADVSSSDPIRATSSLSALASASASLEDGTDDSESASARSTSFASLASSSERSSCRTCSSCVAWLRSSVWMRARLASSWAVMASRCVRAASSSACAALRSAASVPFSAALASSCMPMRAACATAASRSAAHLGQVGLGSRDRRRRAGGPRPRPPCAPRRRWRGPRSPRRGRGRRHPLARFPAADRHAAPRPAPARRRARCEDPRSGRGRRRAHPARRRSAPRASVSSARRASI